MRTIKNYPLQNMSIIIVCCVLLTGAGFVKAQSSVSVDQLVDQIRQIDSRISELESELSSLESQSGQTSRDSTAIVSASVAQLSQIQSKIAQVDNAVAAKKNEIAAVKAQRADLARDSLQKVSAFNNERSVLRDKIRQLEQTVTATESELKLLNQRKVQLQGFSQQTADPKQASIQQEKNRYDSIVVVKQEMLNGLHLQLKQLENDSAMQAASLQALRAKNELDLQQINGEIALAESKVAAAKNALAQVKANHADKKRVVNSSVQQLISKKASLASSMTQSSNRISGYQAEMNKLRLSAGALQQKYEAGRAPIVAQVNEAVNTLATREQQNQIWSIIKEKFIIDSSISAKRNELDEVIQQAAVGKRAAKKQIDVTESELNALLGRQDTYLKTPGVRQMEAQLSSMTMQQKRARIEQILNNISNDLSKQTTAKMQADQALARYDANNPVSSDPSLRRMRTLDTLLASEQQKKSTLSSEIESTDFLVKTYKDSITALDGVAYNEISSYDAEYRNALSQRDGVVVRRDQISRNQRDEYAKNSTSIAAIIDRMSIQRQKIGAIQLEIQNAQGRSADAQQRLFSTQQQFEQSKTVASNEAVSLGTTIAEKERAVQEFSGEIQQRKSQLGLLESKFQNDIAGSAGSLSSLDQMVILKNGELLQLNTQRNSLKFEYDNEIKKQQSSIASLRTTSLGTINRKNAIKLEVNSLQTRRSSQLIQIQNQVSGLSVSIERANRDIENANVAYNTAMQDSINFESTREGAFAIAKRSVAKQDSILAALSKEIKVATDDYERGRADSAAAVSMKTSSVAPIAKKIKQLDSLIALKERELATLKGKRMQAVQDSMEGSQGADAALLRSSTELRKKQERIAALEMQHAYQEKEKKRIESEASSKGEQFRSSRQLYSSKITTQLSHLGEYQGRLAQLNADLKSSEAALAAAEGRAVTTSTARNVTSTKSTINNSKDAQSLIEKIYTLMGENKMSEAKTLFTSNVVQLKKFGSPDAVKMLESSF
jgi:chromosome segregation ATPase